MALHLHTLKREGIYTGLYRGSTAYMDNETDHESVSRSLYSHKGILLQL